MRKATIVASVVLLAACMPDPHAGGPAPGLDAGAVLGPVPGSAPSRNTCLEQGGRWGAEAVTGETPGVMQCYLPEPDADQPCAVARDCSGYCLAETRTCSRETPMPDCAVILGNAGQVIDLCDT